MLDRTIIYLSVTIYICWSTHYCLGVAVHSFSEATLSMGPINIILLGKHNVGVRGQHNCIFVGPYNIVNLEPHILYICGAHNNSCVPQHTTYYFGLTGIFLLA